MNTVLPGAPAFFESLFQASWQAALLVLVVLVVQHGLGRCLTPAWRHALWWIVLGRLLLPVTPPSSWSVFNLLPQPSSTAATHTEAGAPTSDWQTLSAIEGTPTPFPNVSREPNLSMNRSTVAAGVPPAMERGVSPPGVLQDSWSEYVSNFWKIFLPMVPEDAPGRTIEAGAVAAIVWGVVAIALLTRLAWRNAMFSRRVRGSMRPASSVHVALLEECRTRMGVRQRIELLQGDLVSSPAIYGLFRPRLLLPAAFVETGTSDQLRHVFLHELAHVRRGDLVVHGITRILQALHWFNPVLAWAFRRLRADRELATDALALQVAGEGESRAYGLTIVQWLERWSGHPTQSGTVGILEDNAALEQRIRAIARFRQPSRWAPLTAVLVAALAAVSWTSAQPTPTTAPDPMPVAEAPSTPSPMLPSGDSNRVPLLSDIPWFGPLIQRPPTFDDLPPTLESVRALLLRASAHQEEGQIANAARTYEAAQKTALVLGTNAVPEQILAVQGIQATRLSLAKTAWDRNYLNEALAHADRVLAFAPANQEALELRPRIQERLAQRAVGVELPSGTASAGSSRPASSDPATSIGEEEQVLFRLHMSREVDRNFDLLHATRIPEVAFDGVPLSEVIQQLQEWSRVHSPEGDRVNFMMTVPATNRTETSASSAETLPVGDITIRIDPPLRHVRMIDLLEAITQSASAPLGFTIEWHAVVFQHLSRIRPQLITRVFRVDIDKMGQGLTNLTGLESTPVRTADWNKVPGSSPVLQEKVQELLKQLRVGLLPPKAIFFNDRMGLLMVRATVEEAERVEAAIEALNNGTRPWPEVVPDADAWTPVVPRVRVGLYGQPSQGQVPEQLALWKPASEIPAVPEDRHRPVLIAFEASWALDSLQNRKVLESPRLRDLFRSTRTELYRVDCSHADTLSRSLQQRFGVKQVPGYAVYLPDRQKWTVMESVLTPDSIAALLKSNPEEK
jgi:beta-lactamase regulating signal transducer with metallopeptidase domain